MKKDPTISKIPKSERLCRMLDISPEAFAHGYSVEILGRTFVKVRGGGSILLYTPEEIKIELPHGHEYLSVKGACLSCSSYNRGALGIEGRISSVSFKEDI